MLRAGDLRHRVQIQSVTRTRVAGGGYTEAWTTTATVWAAVEPLEGTEQLRAMQTEASASHRVRMRYRAGVTAQMRVLHGVRVLQVVAPPVNVDGRNEEMQLLTREIA